MRHAVLFSVLSGAVVAAPVLAAAGTAAAPPAREPLAASTRAEAASPGAEAASTSAEAAAGASRVVEYRGLRVPVPAGWEVHRLDRDPSRCVRFDRHAVYLGRPGPQPDCPARVVGRTEALHIEPAGDRRAARKAMDGTGLASLTVTPSADHEARFALPEAGVTITGVYGTDPASLQRILRGARLSAGGAAEPSGTGRRPVESPPPPGETTPAQDPAPAQTRPWVRGKGFDTCTAPSLATMKAWRPSFEVTNIYIGGAARGCAQPNLDASWVRQVRAMGYRITPTYVGLQAPCGSRKQRFTTGNAAAEGAKAAVDAASKAKKLGIPQGNPIYFDMEAYRHEDRACKAAVLRFVDNWVDRLKREGYVPGMYSSSKSGIQDVSRAKGISKPDVIWFANWDGRADVYGDPFFPDHLWSPHRRIKQYRGGHKERHGGVTLNIDSDIVDGHVY